MVERRWCPASLVEDKDEDEKEKEELMSWCRGRLLATRMMTQTKSCWASSSTESTSFSLARQWAPAESCFPSLGSTLFKCGLLPWLLVHRRVLVSSMVSFPFRCVLSRFQGDNCCCAMRGGNVPGVLPRVSSQSQVAWPAFFPLFVIQILSLFGVYLDISGGWIAGCFKEVEIGSAACPQLHVACSGNY